MRDSRAEMNAPDALAMSLEMPAGLASSDASHHVRGMKRLVAALRLLSTARDHESVAAIVLRAARELTGADGATLILREGELCFYAGEDAIAPLWKGRRFPIGDCVAGWSMLNAEPVVIEDVSIDQRIPAAEYRQTFVKSLAIVPLGRTAPPGAIGNYWASQHRPRAYEIDLLQALADAAASALENVQRSIELTNRLNDTAAQLDGLSRELEALTHAAAHDLRAPLRAVVGFNQVLMDEHRDKLDADGRDCLRRVHTSAHRMAHLIDDLVELSRVTRAPLTRGPVNLSSIAQELVADLARAETTRDVRVFIAPGLCAEGDSRLLRRALAALIGNAWKFTRPKAAAEIHVFSEQRPEGDRFVVRDNGVGFDENYSSKLFTPFQRLHAAEAFPGNGIGLAIVKRIIARHGGDVSATSRRGESATFAFTLTR